MRLFAALLLLVGLGQPAQAASMESGSLELAAAFPLRLQGKGGPTQLTDCELFPLLDECIDPIPDEVFDPGFKELTGFAVGTLPGTERYISPSGTNSGTCTLGSPCQTLTYANSQANAGDSIVCRDGTYTGMPVFTTTQEITISAYPDETCTFDGAVAVGAQPGNGWTQSSGNYYRTLAAIPCSSGYGITFCSGSQTNLTGGTGTAGHYPDQVWIGATRLRQTVTLADPLAAGYFYMDIAASPDRLYMRASDADETTIAVHSLSEWLNCVTPNVTVQGVVIKRYTDTASNAGIVTVTEDCDNFTMTNFEIDDGAMMAMWAGGDKADLLLNLTIDHCTITDMNWMGVNPSYVNGLEANNCIHARHDPHNEFTGSPQSGAIKGSRVWNAYFTGNLVENSRSHAVWCDQSCYNWVIANNIIRNNGVSTADNSLFFEISDKLYLLNNYCQSPVKSCLKFSGSSELIAYNNTFVGGADTIWITADHRSKLQTTGVLCADPTLADGTTNPLCSDPPNNKYAFNSDRWCLGSNPVSGNNCYQTLATPAAPATMDWKPRVSVFVNNIVAYPTGTQNYCSGSTTTICITASNSNNNETPIATIIHPAEGARSLPATSFLTNVYAPGTGLSHGTQSTDYATAALFATYAAGAPISLAGIEAGSLTGNTYVNADGTPTDALEALHTSATDIPTDAVINEFLAPSLNHFGCTLAVCDSTP